MRTPVRTLILLSLALPTGVAAQNADRAVTTSLESLYGITKRFVSATAELVPENLYAFRPTEEVRTMGQILAHVANAQYLFCSAAAGETSPQQEDYEQTRTTKARIIDALNSAFAYCDGVYARTSDRSGATMRESFLGPMTAAGLLAFNSAHNYEHYGNLVTYMRINGITPPSSAN